MMSEISYTVYKEKDNKIKYLNKYLCTFIEDIHDAKLFTEVEATIICKALNIMNYEDEVKQVCKVNCSFGGKVENYQVEICRL